MVRTLVVLAGVLAIAGLGVVLAANDGAPPRSHVDGPPPPIPHDDFSFACTKCHTLKGKEMRGMGPVSPLPHTDPRTLDRCEMCHVYQHEVADFAANPFVPFQARPYVGSKDPTGRPPVVPHRILLRENCTACHGAAGQAGAPVTTHPERVNCRQCHVPQTGAGKFK